MGRYKQNEKKQLLIRMDINTFAETVFLNPAMQGEDGFLRYGSISAHFNRLAREDNERTKDRLRKEQADARGA